MAIKPALKQEFPSISSRFDEMPAKSHAIFDDPPLLEQVWSKKLPYRRHFAKNAIFMKNACRFAGIFPIFSTSAPAGFAYNQPMASTPSQTT
ncbi:hypothetical protein [Paenibacillus ferrarius]|uniref:hypothetical protein n=1 Tax=Paenibacillus ferrarius TaxID=1469647 RepID=UPI003D2B78D7